MDTITIPNLDDDLSRRLRVRAAQHGHSIEAEAFDILRAALTYNQRNPVTGNLGEAIRAIVEPVGGIELVLTPRQPVREPPRFE
jgi:antitoxin FitA